MLILALLLAASPALARTDLSGCTSSDSVVVPTGGGTPYGTVIWYVPDTGELCEILDCGGGRAPPKTTVPGCDSYEGTETYSPKYLDMPTSTAADEVVISASASWSGDDDETLTEAPTSQKTTKKETAKPAATSASSGSEDEDDDTSSSSEAVGNSTPASAPATTPAAGSGSGSGSNSTAKATDAASSSTGGDSAETTSSTGGVASMPTAGALMGLVAGAAVYAGFL